MVKETTKMVNINHFHFDTRNIHYCENMLK